MVRPFPETRMNAPLRTAVAASLVAAMVTACGDGGGPSDRFVVTGTIQNNTGAPIPANTRLVVLWQVTSGTPDYSYAFGQGTVDPDAGTFRIELDQPPPAQALNLGTLGVGLIVATTNQTLGNGGTIDDAALAEVVGAAGRYGIIYIGSDGVQNPQWATQFDTGYGVGVGVDVVGDFDQFAPASQSSVVLIIDALENIDFVNWT
jgi:hypothetical protein